MTLLENWRAKAYNAQADKNELQKFWNHYFELEKGFYESLLKETEPVTGTVTTLAEKYGVTEEIMVGILDGIDESLVAPNPIETMDADTPLSLEYDRDKLYKNMVIAKADWLYNLPEWDALLTAEQRDELFREAKKAGTIVKEKKIFPNDPCPCGSGKKYKKCCGRNK